jgi:C4-dicarboxylate-specific signal transduction histidine kinase
MSGFELAELMRGAKKTKSIPIIFVTATAKEQSFMFKGYESGAVDFLLKPLDTHAVKSKVNIFIELYQQKMKQEELLRKLKKTQGELEEALQIREELMSIASDELKIRKNQLKQGVDREKLAEEQFRQQTDELENREDRLKQGADREKFAEEQIKVQREELLHVTRVGKLAEFVSSLAHEINQPLAAILSYAQAAQRMYAGRDPQLEEILQYIVNDDQRAAEVIRRIRVLLKKTKPTFEPLDINALINDTVTLIMNHITARNKVIKFDLGYNLPLIHGDRIQLQQVLLNLISNSLEAMDEKSDSCELLIRTSCQDTNTIMVEVKDSGCGIPMENMINIFTHFFTSKEEGLGMGLSICRSIVEAHGGCLDAKNNSDHGATFYFTIPSSCECPVRGPININNANET